MIKNYRYISGILSSIALAISFGSLPATAQSGGNFTITQSVIASGGGGQTTGGIYSLDGTAGQSLAGESSTGGIFAVRGGFWLPALAPSAALVGVGGQVRTAQGNGIRNVIVTLTDSAGTVRATRSGTFGYFRFADVAVGSTYIFSVVSKRYEFSQPTILMTVQEEIADLEFIAADL